MRLPHISHVAASFAHLSKVCILHICIFFLHKMAFLTAILILFLFPLPISIRFRYLYHLVANIFVVYVVHIFFKTRRIKLRCLHSSLGVLHSLASVIMLTAV